MAPDTLDLVGHTYLAIWDTDKETLRNDLKGSILLLRTRSTRSCRRAAPSSIVSQRRILGVPKYL